MSLALEQAKRAACRGEVPVGAVLVRRDQVMSRAHNLIVSRRDPTAHAELLVLQKASRKLRNERLLGTTLYATLEPCAMCVGALILARVDRVVFGAWDEKSGALGSAIHLIEKGIGNHRFTVTGGVLEKNSQELLKQFFFARRRQRVVEMAC